MRVVRNVYKAIYLNFRNSKSKHNFTYKPIKSSKIKKYGEKKRGSFQQSIPNGHVRRDWLYLKCHKWGMNITKFQMKQGWIKQTVIYAHSQ